MRESTAEESSAEMASGEPHKSLMQGRIRAVVADDSDDWRTVVSVLMEVGESVEVVARVDDVREAIHAVSVLQPELLIIDFGIVGRDALTTSLVHNQFPSLVVIVISDCDTPRLRSTCRNSGAEYFVHKARLREDLPRLLIEIKKSMGISPA